jgi:uncharacterized protein YndB with AHSA1/START domain
MITPSESGRTDGVARVIPATPRDLYRAHLDTEKLLSWRTPAGMKAQLLTFDGRLGGGYRMGLHYEDSAMSGQGKSAPGINRFTGTFEELILDGRIVERIQFETDGPAFARPMIMTTELRAIRDGTKVMVTASQVPTAIARADHIEGIEGARRLLAMLAG